MRSSRDTNTEALSPETSGNGATPPPSLDAEQQQALDNKISLAQRLLLPNPDELNAVATQLVIPIIKKTSPLEYFRTHPSMRLTMLMTAPDTAAIEPPIYGVMPEAVPPLKREKIQPEVYTLYPLVFDTKPLTYKLLQVKPPLSGKKWDGYNLGRRLAAEIAVDKWIAMRGIPGGYEACDPDPEAKFPEVVWPKKRSGDGWIEWSEDDWIEKSLGVTGQLIFDDTHEIFKQIRHLK